MQQYEAYAVTNTVPAVNPCLEAEQRHAIAEAAATAAAVEAVVATAKASVDIIRLSTSPPSSISAREHYAAVITQTSFRGYLTEEKLQRLLNLTHPGLTVILLPVLEDHHISVITKKQSSARPGSSPHSRESYPPLPVTPSPSKMKPLQVRSASPRCLNGGVSRHGSDGAVSVSVPNYMAATESAKARFRSQSATKQRPSTLERERSGLVKKRLSYPTPEPHNNGGIDCSGFRQNFRSPSLTSVKARFVGMEQGSNLSSCYTDSIGGEISPCSTTDLRRWLR
ncbi:hypothetical protein Acr_00g0089470 [Actinidia rufa]|uniref:DUF4005 domain-containing protein n=1 Tax=Actinidia rufa TaxID=165716 RepID=A0A7J0DXA4_9ERIC|nr:hypothetical protein Acr_00g0089470 [Actinidia rufa]